MQLENQLSLNQPIQEQQNLKWANFTNEELGSLVVLLRTAVTRDTNIPITGSLFPRACKLISEIHEEVVARNEMRYRKETKNVEEEKMDPNAGS